MATIEERLQVGQFFRCATFRRPTGSTDRARDWRFLAELLCVQAGELAVQLGHHFQIVGEGAQFGRAAELELDALVEIEGRGKIIRLDAYQIAARSRFNQQETSKSLWPDRRSPRAVRRSVRAR